MTSIKMQRICVKFCVKLGKQLKATHKTLCEAYGNEALSKMMFCEWHKNFQSGRTSTDDNDNGRSADLQLQETSL
jgi:hypothetical protein